jgi:hypothetical protein
MNKIPADDALLFGSVLAVALGAAAVSYSLTDHALLSLGLALIVFGVPSAALAFLAAAVDRR